MAKSSFEKALEKHQKEIARQVKRQIDAEKKLADKQKRESDRQARIEMRRNRASTIVNGQPTVGDIKILDSSSEELVSLISEGYSRDDYQVTNNDIDIPAYLENDFRVKKCLSPAKKYKLYKSSINKSLHFAQRRLSSSTRG